MHIVCVFMRTELQLVQQERGWDGERILRGKPTGLAVILRSCRDIHWASVPIVMLTNTIARISMKSQLRNSPDSNYIDIHHILLAVEAYRLRRTVRPGESYYKLAKSFPSFQREMSLKWPTTEDWH